MAHAWLAYADERTLLLPDVLPGHQRGPEGPAHLPAAQLGRGQLPVPRRDRLVHGPAALRGPPAGDAAQRGPLHERAGRHPGRPRPRVGQARPAEPLRRGGVREGRAHRDHRAARPHALVLPDGRHDGRPHEARAGRERLRPAARRRRRAERRRAPDARPPRADDRRPALPRVGRADRRRVRAGGPPAEPRPARLHVGLREARGPRPHAAARPRERDRGGPRAARGARDRARRRARPRPTASRSAGCSTASWPRPTPTASSTTRSARPTSPRLGAPLRQLGLRVRGRLHALHGHGRGEVPRGGAARAPEPAALPRPRLGERQPRRLRRRDRERHLPREPRAGARGARLDRDRDRAPHRLPAGGRHDRALVRRRQLGPDAAALRDDEDAGLLPRRLAGGRAARRRARGRAALRLARGARGLEGPAALRPRPPPPRPELRAQLRPPQRVAGVVHGRREHASTA